MKKALHLVYICFAFFFTLGTIQAHYIYTSTSIANSFCAGSAVSVPYTFNYSGASVPTTNVFTAQLSDSTGSFSNPINIGSLTTNANGTISATLPATIPSGKHYRIRVIGSSPAVTGFDNGTDIVLNAPPGNPAIFGNGFWNVYCYNGNMDSNPTKTVYFGKYTENTLGFDSRTRYPYSGNLVDVPSKANAVSGNAYNGCTIETIHTVIYKRAGFPCGFYQLDVTILDDVGYLLIDGMQVWTYSACCVTHPNVWTGFLTSTSTIEFKYINKASGSAGVLNIQPIAPIATIATNAFCTQFNANWTLLSQASSYSIDVASDAAFTNIIPGYNNLNVGNNSNYSITGLNAGAYYYRVRANFACGASANSNTIKVSPTAPVSGTTTWIGQTSNDWFDASNWCGIVPTSSTDVVIPGGGKFMPLIINSTASSKNIRITDKGSLTNNKTLSLYGDWTNNGTYLSTTGTVEIHAASSSINGTGSNNFYGLEVKTPSAYINSSGTGNNNNSNSTTIAPTSMGSLQLNSAISISGHLTLTNGIIYTSATNLLSVNAGGTISTGNKNSYVDGPMKYTVAASGNTLVNLPLGNAGDWRPAVVSVDHTTTASVTYTAKLTTSSARALGYTIPSTLSHLSSVHYWQIDRENVANLSNAKITLSYDVNDQVSDYQTLAVSNAPASAWSNLGGQATANTTGTITSNSFTSFGKFTLANLVGGNNPLPVNFLEFKATKDGEKVVLEWSTSSEKNNDFFTVEKSADGTQFETITTVKGAGNSSTVLNYKATDEKLTTGLSYYRIKQTDFDKNSMYSMVVCVNYKATTGLTVCGNPANSGAAMLISLPSDNKEVLIVVRDVQGQEYYSKVILSTEDHQLVAINMQPELTPGMYIVVASSDNNIYSQKIIVR